ncbi:aminotransferase [Anderseniella sp. Alg231-50]|uniref:aminotransferase n=1 Tax=Anderseniella sp. Alg231-50 TaxID=1922226 RepID=UPI000D54FDDC
MNKNLNIEELVAADNAHHFHPFTDHKSLHSEGGARVITQASGVHIWDGKGNKLFDAMAGLWCVNIGYGRKELADAAYRQMQDLPFYNTFFKTTTVPATLLAEKVASLLPDRFKQIFFVNSGSEANDTMVRFIRRYWEVQGQPERQHIVSRHRAYHGSTCISASLGGMSAMHAQGGLPLPNFHHVLEPDWFQHGGDMSPEEFGLKAAREVEAKIKELGPDKVAAFVGEPIQGAGGVIVPPDSYWPYVQKVCREHGIPIVADEVICGFGRTGNWWGHETMGIDPDIVVMAKGLSSGYQPIGAVAVSDGLIGDFFDKGGEFFHGYTYSGHPVACAVALENIRIMQDEKLIEHTAAIAPYVEEKMGALSDHPIVGEVRVKGLIGAIELVRDKQTRARFDDLGRVGGICREHCFDNNLVMRACWDTMVFSPPLCITEAEVDEWVDLTRKALDATYADVKGELS